MKMMCAMLVLVSAFGCAGGPARAQDAATKPPRTTLEAMCAQSERSGEARCRNPKTRTLWAWELCLEEAADVLAVQSEEPAPVIVTAVFGSCWLEEHAFNLAWTSGDSASPAAAALRDGKAEESQKVLARVVAIRAARKRPSPAPRPPIDYHRS